MNLDQLAAAYARLSDALALPAMSVRQLHREPRPLPDPAAAWQALTALNPRCGWLQFQSAVCCFAAGEVPQPEADWGGLLAAEAVDGQGRSLLVRQDGRGGLLLVVASDGDTDGAEPMLADEVKLLATGRAPGRLHYRRYWQPQGAAGLVPVFAAFIGFAQP